MVFRLNRKIRSYRRIRAAEVDSPDIHFEYTPKLVLFGKPGSGTLDFLNDIVSIGIDDNGNVILFICPQKTDEIDNVFASGTLNSEVEVGQVGGKSIL